MDPLLECMLGVWCFRWIISDTFKWPYGQQSKVPFQRSAIVSQEGRIFNFDIIKPLSKSNGGGGRMPDFVFGRAGNLLFVSGWVTMAWSKVLFRAKSNLMCSVNATIACSIVIAAVSAHRRSTGSIPRRSQIWAAKQTPIPSICHHFPEGETYQFWYCEPSVKTLRTYDTLVLTSVLTFLRKVGLTVHWSWLVYR